ncbi:unnamed protein product [Symbiodinium necroappetens]|uniref:Uncharacterized protein n=1 Tax=Symbiodinium necroappetens TaxID=1628268 RepID=A0A812ZJF5_9DINO|nr:unnamed protein product [Symbiodinium necroappetens]
MLGGSIEWSIPADTSAAMQYNIYFSYGADYNDSSIRDVFVSGLATTVTQQTVPAGTSKFSQEFIEEVTCNFTIADTVLSVVYNGVDITHTVNGTLADWTSTKRLSFRKVPGAYLVIAGSSVIDSSWCSPTEDVCIAGQHSVGDFNFCLYAGFSIRCSDGLTGASGWEAYGSNTGVDAIHQAGLGSGWQSGCISESGFYLVDDDEGAKIWAGGGERHAAFRWQSMPVAPTSNETYNYIMLFAESTLAEQTTPAVLAIDDGVSSVTALRFVDEDLCPDQLGGEVRWTGEGYLPRVSSYSVYFALAPSGIGRSLLGQGLIGTTSLIIPQATLLQQNFTDVVIYVESSLVQQRSPAMSIPLVDDFEASCESVCAAGGSVTIGDTCSPLQGVITGGASIQPEQESVTDLTPRLSNVVAQAPGNLVLISSEENQADNTQKTFMVMEGISPVNLVSLLRKLSIPRDFDVLSMPQVDNVDLPMLDTLLHGTNSPGFMMAEVTDEIPPPSQVDFGM